jgi:hypothetical protein
MNEPNLSRDSPELTLALMALKGRRYEEADRRYTRLAERTNDVQAWLGVGLAKLNRLVSGHGSVEEVAVIFAKAVASCPDSPTASALEAFVAKQLVSTITHLYQILFALQGAADEAQMKAFGASIMGGVAAGVGMLSKNWFATFATLDVFDRSLDEISEQSEKSEQIGLSQQQVKDLIGELTVFVRTFGVMTFTGGESRPLNSEHAESLRLLNHVEANARCVTGLRPTDWVIKRGNQQSAVPDLETLQQMSRDGQVQAGDWIYNLSFGRWWRADQLSELQEAFGVRATDWVVLRGNDRFVAPDLPTLKEWCHQRLFSSGDSIYHVSLGGWKRADAVGELEEAFRFATTVRDDRQVSGLPADEQQSAVWFIRRGEEQFEAPDAQSIQAWIKEGRVWRDDFVWNTSFGNSWRRASEVTEFRESFGIRPGIKPVALVTLIVVGFLSCTGLMILSTISDSEGTRSSSSDVKSESELRDDECEKIKRQRKAVREYDELIRDSQRSQGKTPGPPIRDDQLPPLPPRCR